MVPQVGKSVFKKALLELGHDPGLYEGKRLSLGGMCELYELEAEFVLDAIDRKDVAAHYDYFLDTIWVDALDAAHFYYCYLSRKELFET